MAAKGRAPFRLAPSTAFYVTFSAKKMASKSYSIPLLHGDRQEESCLEVEYLSSRKVRLALSSDTFSAEEQADDSFSALQNLRRNLRKEGIDLLCYGASRNVFPSAMSREGTKAYRTFLGRPGRAEDLVDIFERGPDIDMASVEDQEAFHREWFESLGRK